VSPEGSIVLNADDERSVEIGTRAKGRVVYFSRLAGNPVVEKHVGAGGQAVVLQGGAGGGGLYLLDGPRTVLLFSGDIAGTFGECGGSSIVNALAAAAACVVLDVDSRSIELGLSSLAEKCQYQAAFATSKA
jgi:cyanophycin synthetase